MSAPKSFSYDLEKAYHRRRWPELPRPYRHLDAYLTCWLNPRAVFVGKRVLDIGAGECTYTRLIAERYDPEHVVACELFRERLLPAARANANPRLTFIAADCFRLPFGDNAFDVVFGSLVLHQLPNLGDVTREVGRVLRADGMYVGIEPNPLHPAHLYRYFLGHHSPNQYLLGPRHLTSFTDVGFVVRTTYFYAKRPHLRNRFLTTCIGIVATRGAGARGLNGNS